MARSLENDAERARYRSMQLAPSNRALALAMERRTDPRAVDWWIAWSRRRKSPGVFGRGERVSQPGETVLRALRPAGARVAIVDYAVLDSAVVALVIAGGRATIERLPTTPQRLLSDLSRIYSTLAPRVGMYVDRHRARFDIDAAAALYDALLKPLVPLFGEARRIVIVPDGFLYLVPFDGLVTGEDEGRPTYVLERWTIELALNVHASIADVRPIGNRRVLAMAASAEPAIARGFHREVDAIRMALPGRDVAVLRDSAATEQALRRLAEGSSVVHVAAHARPNLVNPDVAEIRLTPDNVHDGRLLASEVRTLPLRDAVVVLSACETAAGPIASSEGPLSLSRAFFQAGARQVIATLSPVGETAADLITAFYARLGTGRPVSEALRDAKLASHQEGRSPLAWAPFVVMSRSP
jgi:CHAT domain-containing protein